MRKLSYVGIGKHPVTGNIQVAADTEVDDIPGLIEKMETMDKIKPGDISNGAIPVKDLFTGEIVGYIK